MNRPSHGINQSSVDAVFERHGKWDAVDRRLRIGNAVIVLVVGVPRGRLGPAVYPIEPVKAVRRSDFGNWRNRASSQPQQGATTSSSEFIAVPCYQSSWYLLSGVSMHKLD